LNHTDHVALIRGGVHSGTAIWGELGCGDGAFTRALANLLLPGSTIHAVDRNRPALRSLETTMARQHPRVTLITHNTDFTQPMPFMPRLDGLLLANSLHFVTDKGPLLRSFRMELLRENGRVLVVEYNTDRSNKWVPYPLSWTTWQDLASEAGFKRTTLLATHPSRFLGEFYAAIAQ